MIQRYRETEIKGYRNTGLQRYRDYRDTGIQGSRDTDILRYRDT